MHGEWALAELAAHPDRSLFASSSGTFIGESPKVGGTGNLYLDASATRS